MLQPAGPQIELFDLPDCVALAELAGKNDPNSIYSNYTLSDFSEMLASASTESEIAQRKVAVEAARAKPDANPPRPEVLQAGAMSCLAVFSSFAKKEHGEE
ncbi:MAG: hypothetical protein ABI667_02010 [Sphingomicrobium sp.]